MSVQDAIEITGDPAAVYRLYDAAGALLYVGITRNLADRFARHEAKPWWPLVARKTMTWYGSREEAETAEDAAIKAERPVHNIAGIASDEIPAPRTGRRRSWAASAMDGDPVPLQPRRVRKPVPRAAREEAVRRFSYPQIAEHLEGRIKSGEFEVSRELPSAADLQVQYRAGAIPVRRALAVLMNQGLARQHGAGATAKLKVKAQKPAAGKASPGARRPGPRTRTLDWHQPAVDPLAPGVWHGVCLRLPAQ